ncbi:MAG: biotin--[acetyl-CoA-carboxylase] ligase [Oscillospiraceae bacterium]
MTTKEKLIELFEANKGEYFSGEDIAKALSISRTAVWKAVKQLQSDGYMIDAITNKGYSLSPKTDILSPLGIEKYLNFDFPKMEIVAFSTIASTNSYVREKAAEGKNTGYTVVSNEQTAGRGRLGRNFYSPPDTGLYISTLLRPKNNSANEALNITTMAAVAMCEAIESLSSQKAEIKWVNDIYVGGKKVCGILTDGSLEMESNTLEYAILGLGINIYRPKNGFPKEIKNTAGFLFDTPQNDFKNCLAGEFLNKFMAYYNSKDKSIYINEYRKRSLVVGKKVKVISKGETKDALVIKIDDSCRLHIKYDDGKEEFLSSGEISIKL